METKIKQIIEEGMMYPLILPFLLEGTARKRPFLYRILFLEFYFFLSEGDIVTALWSYFLRASSIGGSGFFHRTAPFDPWISHVVMKQTTIFCCKYVTFFFLKVERAVTNSNIKVSEDNLLPTRPFATNWWKAKARQTQRPRLNDSLFDIFPGSFGHF